MPRLALAVVFLLSFSPAPRARAEEAGSNGPAIERLQKTAERVRLVRGGVTVKSRKGSKRLSRQAALRKLYRQMAALEYKSVLKEKLPAASRAKVRSALKRLQIVGEPLAAEEAAPPAPADPNACPAGDGTLAGIDAEGSCYFENAASAVPPAPELDAAVEKKMRKLGRAAGKAGRKSSRKASSAKAGVSSEAEEHYERGQVFESMADAATQPAFPPVVIDTATGQADLSRLPSGEDVAPMINQLEAGQGEVIFAPTLSDGSVGSESLSRGSELKKAYLLAAAADVHAALVAGIPPEKYGEVDATLQRMQADSAPGAASPKARKAAKKFADAVDGVMDGSGSLPPPPEADPSGGTAFTDAVPGAPIPCNPDVASCPPAEEDCSLVAEDGTPLDTLEPGPSDSGPSAGQKIEGRYGRKKGDKSITSTICGEGWCKSFVSLCKSAGYVVKNYLNPPEDPQCEPGSADPKWSCQNGGTCNPGTLKCDCAGKYTGNLCQNLCDPACGPNARCSKTECVCKGGWGNPPACDVCDGYGYTLDQGQCVLETVAQARRCQECICRQRTMMDLGNAVSACASQGTCPPALPPTVSGNNCGAGPRQGLIVRGRKSGRIIFAAKGRAGKKAAGPARKSKQVMTLHRSAYSVTRRLKARTVSRREKASLFLKRAQMYAALAASVPPDPAAPLPPAVTAPVPEASSKPRPPFAKKAAVKSAPKAARRASLLDTNAVPEEVPPAEVPEPMPAPETPEEPDMAPEEAEPAPPTREEIRKRDESDLDDMKDDLQRKIEAERQRQLQKKQGGEGR